MRPCPVDLESGLSYLCLVIDGELICGWNHLSLFTPLTCNSHACKGAVWNLINAGRCWTWSYTGRLKCRIVLNTYLPGNTQQSCEPCCLTAGLHWCVFVSYRWLWKAGGKIFCPGHGVSFYWIQNKKSKIICEFVSARGWAGDNISLVKLTGGFCHSLLVCVSVPLQQLYHTELHLEWLRQQ